MKPENVYFRLFRFLNNLKNFSERLLIADKPDKLFPPKFKSDAAKQFYRFHAAAHSAKILLLSAVHNAPTAATDSSASTRPDPGFRTAADQFEARAVVGWRRRRGGHDSAARIFAVFNVVRRLASKNTFIF